MDEDLEAAQLTEACASRMLAVLNELAPKNTPWVKRSSIVAEVVRRMSPRASAELDSFEMLQIVGHFAGESIGEQIPRLLRLADALAETTTAELDGDRGHVLAHQDNCKAFVVEARNVTYAVVLLADQGVMRLNELLRQETGESHEIDPCPWSVHLRICRTEGAAPLPIEATYDDSLESAEQMQAALRRIPPLADDAFGFPRVDCKSLRYCGRSDPGYLASVKREGRGWFEDGRGCARLADLQYVWAHLMVMVETFVSDDDGQASRPVMAEGRHG